MSNKPNRPKARDRVVTFRSDDEAFDEATARAKQEGRSLGGVLRAFLSIWGMGEYPSPPELPDENIRAAKRKKGQG